MIKTEHEYLSENLNDPGRGTFLYELEKHPRRRTHWDREYCRIKNECGGRLRRKFNLVSCPELRAEFMVARAWTMACPRVVRKDVKGDWVYNNLQWVDVGPSEQARDAIKEEKRAARRQYQCELMRKRRAAAKTLDQQLLALAAREQK